MKGKEVSSAITDLDGRFGFLVEPGIYKLKVQKTNYIFPSQKLAGKINDELYRDLYFGENLEVKTLGEVIIKNIPLDPVNFDWNEFAKRDKGLMKFYSKWDIVKREFFDWFFVIGFIFSSISYIFTPYQYNLILMTLYVFLSLIIIFGLKPKTYGYIKEKETGFPLSFAIVRVFLSGSETIIASKTTDKYGKYYCLVPPGKYYIKVEKKNDDGSYSTLYTSSDIDVTKKGIINENFRV
ncbi:MAG: carboxypeptidase-like regulatory domain-containing protein [Candidatus Taylorbacteria bacterium]|nr:carboxypeptidase-like regulatory domain-containing protein [Candidatus Taylorbacteria bacterium]